ncbi:MAG: YdbL family protein [Novosphingobium sp.]|nr:YdbL family protein [Novosphingobium sp.]
MLAKAGWATLAALVLVAPASAQQRDPAYAAARASGQVGEKVDGYLGFPVAPSAEIRRLADDINIKRKAVYAERAEANGATIEEYAFSAGCQAIARSVPGEKYQAPDGSWQTRTAAAPLRDPRCP